MRRERKQVLLDWGLILATIVIALALINVPPDSHAFSVADLSISYPHRDRVKVPIWLFVLLAIILPAASIIGTTLLGAKARNAADHLAELNLGIMGLGISLATACVVLNIKNLSGKPRPDFLAICRPVLQDLPVRTVGGYGQEISPLWVMVDERICAETDKRLLYDALRSFPSGYATISFASLVYLSLWLSNNFNIALPPRGILRSPSSLSTERQPLLSDDEQEPLRERGNGDQSRPKPVYLLFLPYLPLGLAIFLSGTRYFDYRNHGFDVLAGAAAGTVIAWFSHRWCRIAR